MPDTIKDGLTAVALVGALTAGEPLLVHARFVKVCGDPGMVVVKMPAASGAVQYHTVPLRCVARAVSGRR